MTTRWKSTNRKKKRGKSLIFPLSFLFCKGVRGEGLLRLPSVWFWRRLHWAKTPLGKVVKWWNNIWQTFHQFLESSEHFATEKRGDLIASLTSKYLRSIEWSGGNTRKECELIWLLAGKYNKDATSGLLKSFLNWFHPMSLNMVLDHLLAVPRSDFETWGDQAFAVTAPQLHTSYRVIGHLCQPLKNILKHTFLGWHSYNVVMLCVFVCASKCAYVWCSMCMRICMHLCVCA